MISANSDLAPFRRGFSLIVSTDAAMSGLSIKLLRRKQPEKDSALLNANGFVYTDITLVFSIKLLRRKQPEKDSALFVIMQRDLFILIQH